MTEPFPAMPTMIRSLVVLLGLLVLGQGRLVADPTPIWIEGETPAKKPDGFQASGWGKAEFLSDRQWLHATLDPDQVTRLVPDPGVPLSYPFKAPEAGTYEVWLRLGYEFARAPIRWKVGENAWSTVEPSTFTTDLMAIADFAEVAWLKVGSVTLPAGAHTFDLRVLPTLKDVNGRREPDRLLFGLDAICLAPAGSFRPNGPQRPGQQVMLPVDREAGQTVYEFPAQPEAPPGTRQILPLGGLWQMARFDENEITNRTGPVTNLPADRDGLLWHGVRVPGDLARERPEFAYCHRWLYRARVRVPEAMAGRSFVLRFPNNALFTTVFVNGQSVVFSATPCAPFECEISQALKPGAENEIVVAIKDLYYAIARTAEGRSCRYLFNYPPEKFFAAGGLGLTRFADYPVLFKVRRSGILETPSLIVAGPAYTSDLFCKPSVAKKELALDVTLTNPTPREMKVDLQNVVRLLDSEGRAIPGEPALTFPARSVTLPPGKSELVALTQPWPSPKLWWPDDPQRYTVETTLVQDNVAIDRQRTNFGFREWGIKGTSFTLNGIPWYGRADQRHAGPQTREGAIAAVQEWRKNGQTMMRFWGDEPWTGATQEETLDFFDRVGVPVRRSGIFDGEVASYQLVTEGKVHQALFDNWRAQLAAWVKAERNHPSVMIWSIENEITYINARNFGWLKQVEPEIRKAIELVRQVDPTRPAMIDGGDSLMDQSLAVAGVHYLEGPFREYPDEAYTLSRAYRRHEGNRPRDPWPLPKDRPLFLGESFFANGFPPAAYSEIGGDPAFLGRKEAAPAVTRFARMLAEGYRWHGIAGLHFWFAEGPNAEHYRAWQPVAVLMREWNTVFAGEAKVTRTLKVFNETRTPQTTTVHWLFQTRNATPPTQRRGKISFNLPAGESREFTIELAMPKVPAGQRVDAELILSCDQQGKTRFLETKVCSVVGTPAKIESQSGQVAVWDPQKRITESLSGLVDHAVIASIDDLPKSAKVLIVGPNALSASQATDPRWKGLAARGVRLVVLDQDHPLHYQAIPADMETTTFAGSIAFPENPAHPLFRGLKPDDFSFWSQGSTVYRNTYRKPTQGGRSLLQCDAELSCTPLVEVPVGTGLMLLSQLAIGAKPRDPVAHQMLANLVRYALDYAPSSRPTRVVLPDGDPRLALLNNSGLKFERSDDLLGSLSTPDIVIVDATPTNLTTLAENLDKVEPFTTAGGWLMLWGVTPSGLSSFNKIVGHEHLMRPFRMERVRFPGRRDPLSAGLSLRDIALESSEKIYPWAGDRYPASDTFSHIVDFDDIAPFATTEKYANGWTQMTNGLTSADSWKFIFYHDQSKAAPFPSWQATLPREEELTGFSVVINAHYRKITRLRLVLTAADGKAVSTVLELKPEGELRQDFSFSPRKCKEVALEPLSWTDDPKPVIGIDNIWLRVRRPVDFAAKVVPLVTPAGLVKYPRGKGGIILNEVRILDREANPENADKKRRLVSTLLMNLGAAFQTDRVIVPGEGLTESPIPLNEACNLFLSADRGWPFGPPDLGGFPVGEQKFGTVRFDIRDFRTSPLPAAVALRGPTSAGKFDDEVKGIKVGQKADALFFLQSYVAAPSRQQEAASRELFHYRVHYQSGEVIDVPIMLGRGIGKLVVAEPKELPQARLAWTASIAPGKGPANSQLAVYLFTWTNPHPDQEITSIDMVQGKDPSGSPVLLGLTVGRLKP